MPRKLRNHTFKPRARIMHLLGDQLIRDAGIAVFELVKNAYDADASVCTVTMHHIDDPERASIVVKDDGSGMSLETVTGVWLEPGTEHRREQKAKGKRSPKLGRLPLGDKGIGRFAAHKLGERICLVTRAAQKPEVVVDLDWESLFSQPKYLSEVDFPILTRSPELFTQRQTGTRIEVTGLRQTWTRGKVRDLHRAVTSICSPFGTEDRTGEFRADLVLEPDPGDWLAGLLTMEEVIDLSLFRATGLIEGNTLTFDYAFEPLPAMEGDIDGRTLEDQEYLVRGSMPEDEESAKPGRRVKRCVIDLDEYGVGPVDFAFYIYDLSREILNLSVSDKSGLRQFLKANGGVRVYRDGVRVYDYGEPGNDWLGLGGRRVNTPTLRIGNNQVLGAVMLDGKRSAEALVEKTNREGFVENDAYEALRVAVTCALGVVEAERHKDRLRLRETYSNPSFKEPVVADIGVLRARLKKKGLLREFGPIVDRIEKQFVEVRERLVTAAGSGLSLTVVLHEVEKIVAEASKAVDHGKDIARIRELIHRLSEVVDGLGFLVRSSGRKKEKASLLVKQALFNFAFRFRVHKIAVVNGLDQGCPDFSVRCVRRLIVATLTNLLDNSVYWLQEKGSGKKRVYVGTTDDLKGGPALVVADNGPGFHPQDTPEYLTQPFFTRREDGMGLGLHIASEVAKIHKGRLLFPSRDDLELPAGITGAIIALQIPNTDIEEGDKSHGE